MQTHITGGEGFLGGHLAETLVNGDRDVTVFANDDPVFNTGIGRFDGVAARFDAADHTYSGVSKVTQSLGDEPLVRRP